MAEVMDCQPIVELSECLRDSPKFRLVLEENENDIELFESKIEKLVKLCSVMVDIGKSFIKAKSNFINGIWDLLVYFKDDPLIVNTLNRMVQTLTELLKYDTILIDQANRAVGKNLSTFIREDIYKVKETKRHFDKISDDLDNALIRHSQSAKTKPHECEEASNILTATRSCFQHLALDYVTQISCLKSKKRHEVLDSILCLMHAYGTYYHQGSDLFQDFEPLKKETANNIVNMRNVTNSLEKKLENRHTLVSSKDIIPTLIKSDRVRLEGYLFKRTSNAFKTWNRRWFIIQDHQLVYQKRSHEKEVTVMEEDLRLCTAKPVSYMERKCCFEVLSPSKSHILQADSEETCQQWITAMQAGIDAAYNNNELSEAQSVDSQDSWCTASSNSTSKSSNSINNLVSGTAHSSTPPAKPPRATYAQILLIPGNEFCCDCGCPEPKWASINIGITLCIECSGIHRSLGVHLSKVRSLNLDAWDLELIKVMSSLGNSLINSIYEAKVDENAAKRAFPECDRALRELWIKAKYVKKAFVDISFDNLKTEQTFEFPLSIEKTVSDNSMNTMCSQQNVNKSQSITTVQKCDEDFDRIDNCSENINKKNEVLFEIDLEQSLTENQSKEDENNAETQNSSEPKALKENESSLEKENLMPNDCIASNCDNYYNLLLYGAAVNCDLKTMCEALAKGALINWQNNDDCGRTALHEAISSDTVTACEYLLLNGAKSNIADSNGKTPLHLATELGNTGQVCLLLKRGADQSCIDVNGNDALSIAINNANADIVTLIKSGVLFVNFLDSTEGESNAASFQLTYIDTRVGLCQLWSSVANVDFATQSALATLF